MSAARTWLVRAGAALLAVGAIAAVAVALQRGAAGGEGPAPILWGREPCAHCRMLISEPRYAAQLTLPDGSTKSFDDAGCLLRYLEDAKQEPSAIHFHHASQERWLRAPAVAFLRGGRTPMGYGLVAVDPGTPGAITQAQAASELREAHLAEAGGEP